MKTSCLWCALMAALAQCFLLSFSSMAQSRKELSAKFVKLPYSTTILAGLHEVTNEEFRLYVEHLKREGKNWEAILVPYDPSIIQEFTPNTLPGDPDSFTNTYLTSQGFAQYPVINIRYETAVAYCAWLTEQYNKVNATGKGEYKKVMVRLPTEREWEIAAFGNIEFDKANDSSYFKPSNWNNLPILLPGERGNWNLPAKKSKSKMYWMANFKPSFSPADDIPDHFMDGYRYTSPVKIYVPNCYGLYGVIGNAAEMVAEEGVSKGGSWDNSISECFIPKQIRYDGPKTTIGFRVFLEVVEEK